MILTAACSVEQIQGLAAVIQPALVTGTGVVTGRVLDQTNQRPIADARVTVGPVKVVSAADGTYSAPGLAAGTLFLKVEATDYQVFFGEVNVSDGTIRFDIPLRRVAANASASPNPSPTPSPTPTATQTPHPNPGNSNPVAMPTAADHAGGY